MQAMNHRPTMCAQSDIDARARTIMHELRAMQDPERAEGVQRFFKGTVAALGIDAATMRRFAREHFERLGPSWTVHDAADLCDRLLHERELEIRGAGLLILGGFYEAFEVSLLVRAEHWLETRLDNWALVDSFCGFISSPLLERDPTVETTLRKWSHARSLWLRRAALVTLVPLARHGEQMDLAYELAREHLNDSEDLIHKATGWLLREAGRTDVRRLRRFLREHGTHIPRTALRYAIERFPDNERARWLQSTRA